MFELLIEAIIVLVKIAFVIGLALHIVPGLIYFERKIAAWMQGRRGPNRVNLYLGNFKLIPGSLQPLADAIKLATKEEIVPGNADKLLWNIAPVLGFIAAGTALAFIPFGVPHWQIGDFAVDLRIAPAEMGLLAILAFTSLGVYGIAMGGWGSGSKFPLMAAVRASAQLISYEVAMGLALISAMAATGTIDMQEFVLQQSSGAWLIFTQPLAALIFLVAAFAENNRLPFDLAECEPELVAGFHIEYTGLKFAFFFLGEYVAMILMSAIFVTCFLGGWSFPGLVDPAGTGALNALLSVAVFGVKLAAVLLFYICIRWTLPRFRYDQLMDLGWKRLVPLGLANLVVTAVVIAFVDNALLIAMANITLTVLVLAVAYALFGGSATRPAKAS